MTENTPEPVASPHEANQRRMSLPPLVQVQSPVSTVTSTSAFKLFPTQLENSKQFNKTELNFKKVNDEAIDQSSFDEHLMFSTRQASFLADTTLNHI